MMHGRFYTPHGVIYYIVYASANNAQIAYCCAAKNILMLVVSLTFYAAVSSLMLELSGEPFLCQ